MGDAAIILMVKIDSFIERAICESWDNSPSYIMVEGHVSWGTVPAGKVQIHFVPGLL